VASSPTPPTPSTSTPTWPTWPPTSSRRGARASGTTPAWRRAPAPTGR